MFFSKTYVGNFVRRIRGEDDFSNVKTKVVWFVSRIVVENNLTHGKLENIIVPWGEVGSFALSLDALKKANVRNLSKEVKTCVKSLLIHEPARKLDGSINTIGA